MRTITLRTISPRAIIRLLLPPLLAIAILAAPNFTTHTIAAPGQLLYVALGDSIPSGTDLADGNAYPRRLGQILSDASGLPVRLDNRARAGERSDGVLANQLANLKASGPALVTLTVGANDFLIPAYECLAASVDESPDTSCQFGSLLRTVPTFESNLHTILRRLVDETDATIAVTTYYNPFPRGSRCAPSLANSSVRLLNSAIGDIAAQSGDRVVVVDLEPIFQGHEGRAPIGWFSPNPVRIACTDIHPNADGHDAIARALWSALEPRLDLAGR
jgi:lysophospholipase L1-like esterase